MSFPNENVGLEREGEFKEVLNNVNQVNGLSDFFINIYKWMSFGVLLSGLAAYLTLSTSLFKVIFSNQFFIYGLFGIQIAIMLFVQFMIKKLSPSVSLILFLIYSGLMGVSLSSIFYIYDIKSIIPTFAGAVALFIGLAFFGNKTKSSFLGWGKTLYVSTFAIMISSLLNAFVFHSSALDTVISAVVLVVFSS